MTICFGGILRDLLCQRPVAIGGQSYALATAAGASVYVLLRQVVVAGYAIPLVVRIAAAAGTTIVQRVWSYHHSGSSVADISFLAPMANFHSEAAAAVPRGVGSLAEQLCDAAARGDVKALRQLVRVRMANVNQGDYDKRTALHLAASEGRWSAVQFLVEEAGAGVNPVDRWGGTPLDDAMRSRHALVANFLRAHGARSGTDARQSEPAAK